MLIGSLFVVLLCATTGLRAEVEPAEFNDTDGSGTATEQRATNHLRRQDPGATDDVVQPRQKDVLDAADHGIRAMNDLYKVTQPKLHSMGLYLSPRNPAFFVAAFNQQSEEAEQLAKFGYASIEAAKKFRNKFPDLSRQALLQGKQKTVKNTLGESCPRRGTPECPPASKRYRTSDGSCNNPKKPWWGSAMSNMQRFLPAVYEDGIENVRRSVTGGLLPSARKISDYVHEERNNPLVAVTHMLMQWGQFVDHDITATGQSRAFQGSVPQCCLDNGRGFQPPEFMHPDCLPIAVPPDDRHLRRLGIRCLEFVRSAPAPREDCEFGAREQLSQVTSYIDASTIYSSSARNSDSLRIFRNGLLQYGKLQSRRPALPRDNSDHCLLGSLSLTCFKAGDLRLSEQPALISLHVVFLRLHNRLATELSALNQHWTDEKIFQEARKIVGALIQQITYREFLPIVLGYELLKIFDIELLNKGYYQGYDRTVNPNIANEFAAAAYRFGHSLVQNSFVRFDGKHRPVLNNISIHEEFSNPVNLESEGSVDKILLGLINQPAQKRDEFISETLTNHLFQTPGFPFGMDLASINIQRGRDHGIPPFVDWREPCGLRPIREWSDLERIMSPGTARKFRDLYASVGDVDLFPAGLAEKPIPGALVGPTFACIIAQQFRSLRRGDRFWYENPFPDSAFTLAQLEQIRRSNLAKILCHTLDMIEDVQPFVMLAPDDARNKRLPCNDSVLSWIHLSPWIERSTQQRAPSESNAAAAAASVKEDANSSQRSEEASRSEVRKSVPADKIQEISRSKPVTATEAPRSKVESPESWLDVDKTNRDERMNFRRQNPMRTKINQQNRIVIKRPTGAKENFTIVINNNAVHSPIYIRDSANGSNLHVNQISNSHVDSSIPYVEYETEETMPGQTSQTDRPHSPGAYYPHHFADPDNPNPPAYGYAATEKPTIPSPGYPRPQTAGYGPSTQGYRRRETTTAAASWLTYERPTGPPVTRPQPSYGPSTGGGGHPWVDGPQTYAFHQESAASDDRPQAAANWASRDTSDRSRPSRRPRPPHVADGSSTPSAELFVDADLPRPLAA